MSHSSISNEIKTIADTILWLAKERVESGQFDDLVRSVYTVDMEVSASLAKMMKSIREGERNEEKNVL